MFNLPTQRQSNIALLSPTVFELEDTYYEQAKALAAQQGGDEHAQWQTYLSLLGLLSFQDWLVEQNIPMQPFDVTSSRQSGCHIHIGDFRVCVLSAEHVLSEQVEFHSDAIESPTQAAHFYVLLEIAEEQDEVWFRGFIRHDQLLQVAQREGDRIAAPLAAFEPEPSRLLSYCRHLEAGAIALPQAISTQTNATQTAEAADRTALISETLATTRTRLSQWLDNIVDEGWQAWDSLQPQVAYATRSLGTGIRCGKLVHLKMQVAENPLALVLTLTPAADDKVSILVQLLPTGRDRHLTPNVQLSLISKKGRPLQTVTSDSRDNYIQLKSFKGKAGMRFSLKVQLESAVVSEEFEI